MMQALVDLAEAGRLPDAAIRFGIRRLVAERRRMLSAPDAEQQNAEIVRRMRESPIAVCTADANTQHYEVPTRLFELMLGPRLKYSACLWPSARTTLAEAEEAMLAKTCERARLCDGQSVLELGCGWGSLTLWMAERYRRSSILAVSNSATQRRHIELEARARGLGNVRVVTANVANFAPDRRFDRIVSVEMFEHLRNPELLLGRIAGWLEPGGELFVHIFCHRSRAYFYEASGPRDWMAREFFSGGTMPSFDLFDRFGSGMEVDERWRVSGLHYHRTLEAWLEKLDRNRDEAVAVLRSGDGEGAARRRLQRWRIFLMACSELFAHDEGREWFVGQYRLSPSRSAAAGLRPPLRVA